MWARRFLTEWTNYLRHSTIVATKSVAHVPGAAPRNHKGPAGASRHSSRRAVVDRAGFLRSVFACLGREAAVFLQLAGGGGLVSFAFATFSN